LQAILAANPRTVTAKVIADLVEVLRAVRAARTTGVVAGAERKAFGTSFGWVLWSAPVAGAPRVKAVYAFVRPVR
jgi:hypothetical protein